MFGKSYPLFKLLGFEVRIDLTWLILGFLVTWSLAAGLFPYYYEDLPAYVYWSMGIAGALGLLLSIVFHELSHSVVARRYGLPIKGITLFIFGGVAQMDEEPANPKAEFLMAIAGPIASFFLALVLYALYVAMTAGNWAVSVTGVISYLAFLNAILGAFNLVPAFPLDGGRALRALLWGWSSDLRSATRTASRIGSGFGLALVLLGIFAIVQGNLVGGMWWILIGMFLRAAAGMSYKQVLMRQELQGEPVSRFMQKQVVTVTRSLSLEEFIEEYVYRYHYETFPVVEDSRLIGLINTKQTKTVPRDEWSIRTVQDVLEPVSESNTVDPQTDAMEALTLMNKTGNSRLLVARDGELAGILALKDLLELLSLKMDLEGGSG